MNRTCIVCGAVNREGAMIKLDENNYICRLCIWFNSRQKMVFPKCPNCGTELDYIEGRNPDTYCPHCGWENAQR
jgi:hypothetical protein